MVASVRVLAWNFKGISTRKGGQAHDIGGSLGGLHGEPRLGFLPRRQPLVVLVNHRGGVAGLLRGEVLIGVQRKVVGAKGVA